MKHAILLMAHSDIEYLSELIDYFDDDFSIYIHLDKKKRFSTDEINLLKSKRNVVSVSRKYKTNWGGFNILKAELFLMKKALDNGTYDYYHLISGQDYPAKSLYEFKYFFEKTNGVEYVEYDRLPRREWDNGTFGRFEYFRPFDIFDHRTKWGRKIINSVINFQIKRKICREKPDQFATLYGGSAWFSITGKAVKHILDYTANHPAFYNRLKYTFATEETYIPTILVNSELKENIENCNLRYIDWNHRNNSFPAILDESDFYKILETKSVFARKIIRPTSQKLIDKLKYRITHSISDENLSLEIADKGFFDSKIFEGHCYDREMAEALCLFTELMEVKTIVDLGCGPGWYVKTLRDAGFSIEGFDGNPNTGYLSDIIMQDGTQCRQLDLTNDIKFEEEYDMVLSLEVGEHIPREFEDIFISNLVNNCKKYLVISWAIEQQKGDGHINCHNNEYIIDKITKMGFVENIPVKNYLRHVAELRWFRDTIFVFQKIVIEKEHS